MTHVRGAHLPRARHYAVRVEIEARRQKLKSML